MKIMEQYKKAFLSMPKEIKEAEVNGETHDAVTVFVTEKEMQNVQISMEKALYIRVSGEKTGYYYTQNLEEDPEKALKTAYENSLYAEQSVPEKIKKEPEKVTGKEENAIRDVSVLADKACTFLRELKKHLTWKEENICLQGSLKAETYGQHTVNFYGLDVSFTAPLYIWNVLMVLKTEEKTITADLSLAASDLESFDMEKVAEELSLKCRAQLLETVTVESGEYPVILSNSVLYYMLGTAWQLFSGCKYVEGTTKLSGMLGEKIGADCLTICDKSTLNGAGFPMYCDSEGNKGKDVTLLEQGVFTNLLQNISSAAALQREQTGNAGRRPLLFGNIATDILVTPKNFCMMPGKNDLDTMVKQMKDGILITESFDIFHTIDISSGDFSIPCWGIRIENGEETGGILSMVLTGNVMDLFTQAAEVGSNFMLHPMVAIENYGIGTCPMRLKKMNISAN